MSISCSSRPRTRSGDPSAGSPSLARSCWAREAEPCGVRLASKARSSSAASAGSAGAAIITVRRAWAAVGAGVSAAAARRPVSRRVQHWQAARWPAGLSSQRTSVARHRGPRERRDREGRTGRQPRAGGQAPKLQLAPPAPQPREMVGHNQEFIGRCKNPGNSCKFTTRAKAPRLADC